MQPVKIIIIIIIKIIIIIIIPGIVFECFKATACVAWPSVDRVICNLSTALILTQISFKNF